MSDVLVFERASASFAATLAQRGHHIVYRANESNHCPGCGRSHWYIGRVSAECGFCGTAIPLAEARRIAPDLWIGVSTHNLDQVLEGELDQFTEALAADERRQKLEAQAA